MLCSNSFFNPVVPLVKRVVDQAPTGRLNLPRAAADSCGQLKQFNVHALLTGLKSCSRKGDLQWGRRLHAEAVEAGIDSNVYVATALIKMYAKSGSMLEARRLFDAMERPDVVSWTALLLGYAENGMGHVALELFSKMKSHGWAPDSVTYVAVLKACTSLAVSSTKAHGLHMGRNIHSEIGRSSDLYLQNTLINMYSKCGSMADARHVFENIQKPDVVSWNVLLLGYADNGEGHDAFDLFCRMKSARQCAPNSGTYVAVFKACISLAMNGGLEMGRRIHAEIDCPLDMHVQSTLISMYSKCGSMADAQRVFDRIQKPNVVSWNTLLSGYAENGEDHAVLNLFSKMKAAGCPADSVTYVSVLKGCSILAVNGDKAYGLAIGRSIHSEIECLSDPRVQSILIDMYAKCGSIVDALQVFRNIKRPDVVSWTALLSGYAENGEGLLALELFEEMKTQGCVPNLVTYVAVLKACTSLAVNGEARHGLEMGRRIHLGIGRHSDLYVQNTLINMYAKCGSMADARQMFDSIQKPNVVSWNALLMGYAENGEGQVTLDLFARLKADRICVPSAITYVAVLKACTSLAANGDAERKTLCLEMGRNIHLDIGCHSDLYLQSSLIEMYAKCGSMAKARQVFDSILNPDVVSWTTLLLGYAENGEGNVALDMFCKMKAACQCTPDALTYVAVLTACTSLAVTGDGNEKSRVLELGRRIHSEIGNRLTRHVQNTLVDMYAKCGSMADSRRVFDSVQNPDVVSWTALLQGYADNGEGPVVLDLFSKMKSAGCAPDSVTYAAVLKACSSVGALAAGRKFHSEVCEFTSQVVTCLVEFYASCGSMVEAQAVFDLHSRVRELSTWNALLTGYSTCGDTASVFDLFQGMQDQGFRPNAITFVCMLLCCSHAGLVEKASEYFKAMPVYGITPTVMHYTCMVDTLGRANQLNEAVEVLQKMPYSPDAVVWLTLLGACHKWKNVEIGSWAFQSLMDIDKTDSAACVLMARIYGSQGMWEEQERVLQGHKGRPI